MPIAASSTPNQNTVKTVTVDTQGSAIGTPLGTIGAGENLQEAASGSEGEANTATSQENASEANVGEATPPVEPTKAEARRMFLQAQKAERRAQEQLKKAEATAKKAAEFEAAFANRKTDPLSVYRALGLDPQEEYRTLTNEALKNVKDPIDPIEDKFAKQEAELARVAEQLRKQQEELELKDLHQQEYAVRSQQVYPVLAKAPDAYESLIAHCGGNISKATDYVYETAKAIFQEQGVAPSFEELATALEDYHYNSIESAIKQALQLKKFSKYGQTQLTPSQENSDKTPDQYDRPIARSRTLTTEVQTTPVRKAPQVTNTEWSKEEHLRRIREKYLGK